MDDHLEDPPCQSRALLDSVEKLVHLSKAFDLLQLHRLHRFPRDPSGFQADCPTVEVE